MIDGPPPAFCEVVVDGVRDSAPLCVLAVVLHGDNRALKLIEKNAAAAGLSATSTAAAGQVAGSMIILKSGSHAASLGFYQTLLAARPIDVKINLMIVPVAKMADGEIREKDLAELGLEDVTGPRP